VQLRGTIEMLESQLSFTRQRLAVREVTTTDVQQTQTRLAGARWGLLAAESTLTTSRAAYRRVIGQDQSGRLAPAAPVDRLSPATLKGDGGGAETEPSIKAAQVGIDVAAVR
jgi:outer membrane protein